MHSAQGKKFTSVVQLEYNLKFDRHYKYQRDKRIKRGLLGTQLRYFLGHNIICLRRTFLSWQVINPLKTEKQMGIQQDLQVLQSKIKQINRIRKKLTVFAY